MDIAGGFEPVDSEGFIKVQSIRIKAYENMISRWYPSRFDVSFGFEANVFDVAFD